MKEAGVFGVMRKIGHGSRYSLSAKVRDETRVRAQARVGRKRGFQNEAITVTITYHAMQGLRKAFCKLSKAQGAMKAVDGVRVGYSKMGESKGRMNVIQRYDVGTERTKLSICLVVTGFSSDRRGVAVCRQRE